MAIKDWKKDYIYDEWKKGNKTLSIDYLMGFDIHRVILNGVIISKNKFKTKSKALAFAKAYMRKN